MSILEFNSVPEDITIRYFNNRKHLNIIVLTKTTAAQNEVALSYHRVRGLYFLAVVFGATIVKIFGHCNKDNDMTLVPL